MSYQPPPPNLYGYGYGPPAPKPKSNALTVLWIVLGIVGFVVVGCCGFGVVVLGTSSDDDDSSEPVASRSQTSASPSCEGRGCSDGARGSRPSDVLEPSEGSQDNPARRGASARNESAQYEILDVSMPDDLGPYTDSASGQWVVVEVAVRNVKNRTIQISSEDFTLVVGGNEIDADDETIFLDAGFGYEDLSPGLRKTGVVAFDVPPADAGRGVLRAEALFSLDSPVYLNLE